MKLHNELGLGFLEFRLWFRKLCLFFKIKKLSYQNIYSIWYLKAVISTALGLLSDVITFHCRKDVLKYSYFPCTILEWKKLDMQIRRSQSFLSIKN